MSALPITPEIRPVRHLQVVDAAYLRRLQGSKSSVLKQQKVDSATTVSALQRLGMLVSMAVAVFLGSALGLSLPGATYDGPTVSYTVSSGDTLWSIAKYVAADVSVADTVEHIKELNGLQSSQLHPGQQLSVPSR